MLGPWQNITITMCELFGMGWGEDGDEDNRDGQWRSNLALLGAKDKNATLNWKMSLWGSNQACSQTMPIRGLGLGGTLNPTLHSTPIGAAKILGAIVTSRPNQL